MSVLVLGPGAMCPCSIYAGHNTGCDEHRRVLKFKDMRRETSRLKCWECFRFDLKFEIAFQAITKIASNTTTICYFVSNNYIIVFNKQTSTPVSQLHLVIAPQRITPSHFVTSHLLSFLRASLTLVFLTNTFIFSQKL